MVFTGNIPVRTETTDRFTDQCFEGLGLIPVPCVCSRTTSTGIKEIWRIATLCRNESEVKKKKKISSGITVSEFFFCYMHVIQQHTACFDLLVLLLPFSLEIVLYRSFESWIACIWCDVYYYSLIRIVLH